MAIEDVIRAYAGRSAEYADRFGSIGAASREDRDAVLAWAGGIEGPIIDVGCGPGQWTNFLASRGASVVGIDPTARFIEEARRRYPEQRFTVGRAEQLEAADGQLGGVLSWFSLIHTAPDEVDAILAEFTRALRPGGGLALGFFEGPTVAPFEHAVTTGFYWPLEELRRRVEAAGLGCTHAVARTDEGARRQGLILATRLT